KRSTIAVSTRRLQRFRSHMADDSTLNAVRAALKAYVDPYLKETLGEAGAIRDVAAQGGGYHARIALGYPVGGYDQELAAALGGHLAAAGLHSPLTIELEADVRPHA